MKISDRDHPFYKPLWRRIAIVAVTAAWTIYETFVTRDGFWTIMALALFGYSIWVFIFTWRPEDGGGKPDESA